MKSTEWEEQAMWSSGGKRHQAEGVARGNAPKQERAQLVQEIKRPRQPGSSELQGSWARGNTRRLGGHLEGAPASCQPHEWALPPLQQYPKCPVLGVWEGSTPGGSPDRPKHPQGAFPPWAAAWKSLRPEAGLLRPQQRTQPRCQNCFGSAVSLLRA